MVVLYDRFESLIFIDDDREYMTNTRTAAPMQGDGSVILGQPYLNSFEANDETFVDELLMWNRRVSNLDEIVVIRMV